MFAVLISSPPAEKDIGVIFDPNLNFRPHMKEICKKANRIMGVIRKTYSYLTGEEFCVLYKALVRSHQESNNVIWAPRYKKDVEKVASQLIQLNKNKSTRGHLIKMRRDYANRDIRQNYLLQRAATMWNNLPEAVVTAKTTNTFKNRYDK